MRYPVFPELGQQLRHARAVRHLTQPALAERLGRTAPRISELERDLLKGRLGRDRLTLLAEICDALDLAPILVPREKAGLVRGIVDVPAPQPPSSGSEGGGPARHAQAFDDVFVVLSDDDDEQG